MSWLNYIPAKNFFLGGLKLTYDLISNVPVTDAASVSDWNAFFDLPVNGAPFTSVSITGNEVNLIGGSGITLKPYLFGDSATGSNLIEVSDNTGCVIACADGVFSDFGSGYGCYGLTKVSLPVCSSLGYAAFADCEGLIELNLPFDSFTLLNNEVFEYCTSLSGIINFPNVVTIGDFCFSNCSAVSQFDFQLAKTAGQNCFTKCMSATSINLPKLETAGAQCFYQCSSMLSFSYPELTSIGLMCFAYTGATSYILPKLVNMIGNHFFIYCVSANTIYLPSCINFGDSAFSMITGATITLTVPISMMTNNGGLPDLSIQYLQANNTVTIIQV